MIRSKAGRTGTARVQYWTSDVVANDEGQTRGAGLEMNT